MMKFYSKFFDADVGFRTSEQITDAVRTSKNYQQEPVSNARLMNFFKTSKQRSYLVATDQRVYCIVDDNRKSQPVVNWSEPLASFNQNAISFAEKSDRTGLVNFGENHKHWLYTKSLFSDTDEFEQQLHALSDD